MQRRTFLKAGTAALGTTVLRAPAVLGQAKPFAGVTINAACFQHAYTNVLKGSHSQTSAITIASSARPGCVIIAGSGSPAAARAQCPGLMAGV